MRGLAAALCSISLVACTVVGHEKVGGWPQLELVEHHVSHSEMRSRCARYVAMPVACAEFDLMNSVCHMWFSADFPPQRAVIEHERLHCLGYDHPGENTMRRLLQRHVASSS